MCSHKFSGYAGRGRYMGYNFGTNSNQNEALTVFTLSGVNLNKLPGAGVAGSVATEVNTADGNTLPNLTNIVPGSLATAVETGHYGNPPNATITTGVGTLVTRLTQAGGSNNYWEAGDCRRQRHFCRAVIKNITSTTLGITETNAGGNDNSTNMVGVVFQPQPAKATALPVATQLVLATGGTLDLGGLNQTVASLSDLTAGQGGMIQSSGGAGTLACRPRAVRPRLAADHGGISLAMSGSGYQTLAGVDTFTGGTTISSGTLQVGNGATSSGSLGSGNIAVNGGALVFNGPPGGNVVVNGTIANAGNLVLDGSGRQRFDPRRRHRRHRLHHRDRRRPGVVDRREHLYRQPDHLRRHVVHQRAGKRHRQPKLDGRYLYHQQHGHRRQRRRAGVERRQPDGLGPDQREDAICRQRVAHHHGCRRQCCSARRLRSAAAPFSNRAPAPTGRCC